MNEINVVFNFLKLFQNNRRMSDWDRLKGKNIKNLKIHQTYNIVDDGGLILNKIKTAMYFQKSIILNRG